jgi:hypothetical protein
MGRHEWTGPWKMSGECWACGRHVSSWTNYVLCPACNTLANRIAYGFLADAVAELRMMSLANAQDPPDGDDRVF